MVSKPSAALRGLPRTHGMNPGICAANQSPSLSSAAAIEPGVG
jgi:hypothetical protein